MVFVNSTCASSFGIHRDPFSVKRNYNRIYSKTKKKGLT